MLLYTKLAAPKVPKKRSRAGCNYCKEKKKKCDETRPQCARCEERGQDCTYEPIKPRQRRKRTSISLDTQPGTLTSSVRDLQKPWSAGDMPSNEWQQDFQATYEKIQHEFLMRNDGDASAKTFGGELDNGYYPWTPGTSTAFSPMTTTTFDLHNISDQTVIMDDEHVDEVVRRESYMPNSSYLPSSLVPFHGEPTPHLEFCLPMYSEFSPNKNRRVLIDHFCNVLSHLIVLREENGNPFQQLVLPLCHTSPAVMDAVYALASAHLEYRGVETGETSEFFHGRAIQALARLIEQGGGVRKHELLAAIMLIVYYEVLVQKGRSNLVDTHLKGAMTILSNVEYQKDATGDFLERAFRFYDVIAALSLGTAPLSSAPGRGSLSPLPPLDARGAASPLGSVDTLLGMATTLWPIIHRLSNLAGIRDELDTAVSLGQSTKAAVLRTELETTTSAIQVALKQWQPILPPSFYYSAETTTVYRFDSKDQGSSDTTAEHAQLQGVLNNSLAYRHSAFVYLYRTIQNYPRDHPLVQQHAHASLVHCIGTVRSDGPMSALLWPLFVAACEAEQSSGDRDLAQQVFVAIDRRQGMANIERAWCIVQEVWRRADEAELTTLQEEQDGEEDNVKDAEYEGSDQISRTHEGEGVAVVTEKNATSGVPSKSWHGGQEREVPSERAEKSAASRQLKRKGGDLWRRVSRDMGVTIVFG